MKTIRAVVGARNTWMQIEKPSDLIKFGLAAFMLMFGIGSQRDRARTAPPRSRNLE